MGIGKKSIIIYLAFLLLQGTISALFYLFSTGIYIDAISGFFSPILLKILFLYSAIDGLNLVALFFWGAVNFVTLRLFSRPDRLKYCGAIFYIISLTIEGWMLGGLY